MRYSFRIVIALHCVAFASVAAQSPAHWKVLGDTTGAPRGCSTATAIDAIDTWFAAFAKADSVAFAHVLPARGAGPWVFTTGRFAPTDTFVRIETLRALLRYARSRARAHEQMRLRAVQFYGWQGRRLGFMPYFIRSADDLGAGEHAGIGKAGFVCGRGFEKINLAPRPSNQPGPDSIMVRTPRGLEARPRPHIAAAHHPRSIGADSRRLTHSPSEARP